MARMDCPHCQGSGWRVVERTPGLANELSSRESAGPGAEGKKSAPVWAIPCDCTASDRVERGMQRARVPERYRHCDFENYETDNELEGATAEQQAAWSRSLAQAKLVVGKFTSEFPAGSEHG